MKAYTNRRLYIHIIQVNATVSTTDRHVNRKTTILKSRSKSWYKILENIVFDLWNCEYKHVEKTIVKKSFFSMKYALLKVLTI